MRDPLLLRHRLQHVADGRCFDEHDVRPEDVIGRHVGVRQHFHTRQVPAAQIDVRLRAVGEDQHLPIRHAERGQQTDDLSGMRRIEAERIDDLDRILAGPRVQRALARQCADLPRHILRVASRRRTKHGPTANPLRRADRALPRASRALLLPRLLVSADHVLSNLGGRVPLPLVGAERLDRLVHHRKVDRAVEQLLGERDGGPRRTKRGKRLRFERHGSGSLSPRDVRFRHGLPTAACGQ